MRTLLSQSTYKQQGIDWPIQAFDADSAQSFFQNYRDFRAKSLLLRGKDIVIKPHLVSTWLDAIVHNPIIGGAVEATLGPDFVLWSSDIANKEANKNTWIPWHQDTPYWNLSDTNVVSVWLALSESKKSNGAMRVFPATHSSGSLGKINIEGDPHEIRKLGKNHASEGNLFSYDHIMDEEVDEGLAMDVELEPGQFSLHNVQLLHGGGPNESEHYRVGFVMRFISSNTFCKTGIDSVTPIRGNAERDYFVHEHRPSEDFSATAMQNLETALKYPSGFGDGKVQ